MAASNDNHRETGAREPREVKANRVQSEFSQEAAGNKRPPGGMGLTEAADDVNDKTRHSDNRSVDPKPDAPSKR